MNASVSLVMEDEAATEPVPERRGLKKGLYLIPSTFTTLNIGLGFYALIATLRAFQLVWQNGPAGPLFDQAAQAICAAVVCDALDGRLARMTKTTTEIGVQLDSIADVVTFGVAPAVLVYAWSYGSALPETHSLNKFGLIVSFLFLMCGAFRLARFNVQAARPRVLAEGAAKLDKKNFVGLPIPAAAGLLAAIIHFAPTPLRYYPAPMGQAYSGLLMALVACLGVLMVSTLRYSSFKSAGTQRSNPRILLLAVAALGMVIWFYSQYALLALGIAYVLHGPLFRLLSLFRRAKPTE